MIPLFSRSPMRDRTRRATAQRAMLTALAVVLAGCREDAPFILQPDAPSASAARGPVDTPVTTTVLDVDTAIAPTLQVRSDGLGVYRNANTLVSIIQGVAGAWVLDSQNPRNGTRML